MLPSSITLPANGVNLRVVQVGQGKTAIVFLYYWGGSSRTWQPVIDQLSGDFRCVAIDLYGWGKSDHTAKNFSLDIQASDVTGTIADLGLNDFIPVGHSIGGKIAQIVASRSPSGLRALVLVAPAPPTPVLISDQEKQMRLGGYSSEEAQDSPHFQTAPNISPKTGCAANIRANCLIKGRSRSPGMVGMSS